jgi:hypothetical protein
MLWMLWQWDTVEILLIGGKDLIICRVSTTTQGDAGFRNHPP